MAIEHNGKIIRSLPEQVGKNLTDIIKLMSDVASLTTLVQSKLTGAMHYKGSVATVADLPATGNEIGDFYNVTSTGANYAWDGTQWDDIGSIVDLSNYARKDIPQTIEAIYTFDYGTTGVPLYFKNSYGTKTFGLTGTWFETNAAIFPSTDDSIPLGSSLRRWKDLYLSSNLTDGTNSVTISHLAANTPIQWYGTQAEYDALATYDSNTIYNILES